MSTESPRTAKCGAKQDQTRKACQIVPNSAKSPFSGRKLAARSGVLQVQIDATRGKNGDKRVPRVPFLARSATLRRSTDTNKMMTDDKKRNGRRHGVVHVTPKGRIPGSILLPFYSGSTHPLGSYSIPTGVLLDSCPCDQSRKHGKKAGKHKSREMLKPRRNKSTTLCTSKPSPPAPLPKGE